MVNDAVKKQNERLAPLIGAWSLALVMPGQEPPRSCRTSARG